MAHQLLIGKGMITLNLKRIFLALTLLLSTTDEK